MVTVCMYTSACPSTTRVKATITRSRSTTPNPPADSRSAVRVSGTARQTSTAKTTLLTASIQNSQRNPSWASHPPAVMPDRVAEVDGPEQQPVRPGPLHRRDQVRHQGVGRGPVGVDHQPEHEHRGR